MSSRSVTPVKQIIKDDKQCPDAPVRKTHSVNPGNLSIVIPPFQEDFTDPRAEYNGRTVMCKTPECKVRRRSDKDVCPGAPVKKARDES